MSDETSSSAARKARGIPLAPEIDEIILEPYHYLIRHPGKEVRSLFIRAFNEWLKVDNDKVEAVEHVVRMLHNASLLIDDIEDNSTLRRGVPVAHSIFGIPATINAANHMYFIALQEVHSLKSMVAVQGFVEELVTLHRGQGLDIFWRDSGTCPDEDEYRDMVLAKTGGLFRLTLKLLQSFSEDDRDYIPLVNCISEFFQILDDYLNLQSNTYTENKSFAEDLSEGKFSFPIIHGIRSNPKNHTLINILKQRPSSNDVKRYAIQCMEECGSFSYTRKRIETLYNETTTIIQSLGGNPALQSIIDRLYQSMEQ